jgi:hypothetical protein
MRGSVIVKTFSFCGAVVLALAPALAVDRWLEIRPSAPDAGEELLIRLYEGEPFAGNSGPLLDSGRTVFQRVWRAGRSNLAGSAAGEGAARLTVTEAGTQLFVHADPPSGRYCKAIAVVGSAPVDDPLRYSEVGHRLEIVPQSDPVILSRGAELEVQVLFEREPLAGARVTALPEAAPKDGLVAAITDEIGLARLKLTRSGRWMVRVRHRSGGESGGPSGTIAATLMLYASGR